MRPNATMVDHPHDVEAIQMTTPEPTPVTEDGDVIGVPPAPPREEDEPPTPPEPPVVPTPPAAPPPPEDDADE